MHNGSVVEHILRSLSFEVEAVPQNNLVEVTTSSKATPLNVKIRVRKKDEAGVQYNTLSFSKPNQRHDNVRERIRLVSSDQTIMSFNVIMEADIQEPIRKPRTNILGIFKPSICLGSRNNEDEYAYLPRSSYKANFDIKSVSKSDETFTKFTLSKNEDKIKNSLLPRRNKDFFGTCKPGGCLDPPFGEDKHPYTFKAIINDQKSTPEYTTSTKVRTSSIFSKKIFKRNKKDHSDEEFHRNEIKTESVLHLYQAGSLQTNSYSNSIITYPPTLNSSELRIKEDKPRFNKTNDDITSINYSFDESAGTYFTIPKKPTNSYDKGNETIIKDDCAINVDHVKSYTTKLDSPNSVDRNETEGKQNRACLRQKPLENHASTNIFVPEVTIQNNESKNVVALATIYTEVEKDLTPSPSLGRKSNHKLLTDIQLNNLKNSTSTDHTGYININETRTILDDFKPTEKENLLPLKLNNGIENIGIPQIHLNTLNMLVTRNSTETENVYDYDLDIPLKKYNDVNSNEIPTEKDVDLTSNEENYLKTRYKEVIENYAVPYEKSKVICDIGIPNIEADDIVKSKNNSIYEEFIDIDSILLEKRFSKQKNAETHNRLEYTESRSNLETVDHEMSEVKMTDIILNSNLKPENASKELMLYGKSEDSLKIIPVNKQNNDTSNRNNFVMSSINFNGNETNTFTSMALLEQGFDDNLTSILGPDAQESDKPENETNLDSTLNPNTNITPLVNTDQEFMLSVKSTDDKKIAPIKKLSVEIWKQDKQSYLDQNKNLEKSVVTLDAKHEMSVYDIVATTTNKDVAETKQALEDKTKLSTENYEDAVSQEKATTTDIPVDLHNHEDSDLLHIWENYKKPIVSHSLFNTDHDISKKFDATQHMNTVKEENNREICNETFMGDIDIFDQRDGEDTYNQSMYKKENENHTNEKDIMNLKNVPESICLNNNRLQSKIKVSRAILSQTQEKLDSASNQAINANNSQNHIEGEVINSDVKDSPRNSLTKFENNESTPSIKHAMIFKDKDNESSRILASSPLDENKDVKTESLENFNDITELHPNYPRNTEVIHEKKETDNLKHNNYSVILNMKEQDQQHQNKQQENLNVDPSHHVVQNDLDAIKNIKTITFATVFGNNCDPLDAPILMNKTENSGMPDYYLPSLMSHVTKLPQLINNFPDDHGSNRAQTTENLTINSQAILQINFAIQSYLGYNKEVIVKSLNADNVIDRYPEDNVILIKRNIALKDDIEIPISSKHDLCIKFKSNKQEIEEDFIKGTGTTYNEGTDSTERYEMITDNIRQTLVAVYEQELVPLRNTITELRENLTNLTSQMLLRDHIFRKLKHTRVIPLRKCGCMRK